MSYPDTLSRPVKIAYGFGLSAEGIKTNAFNLFLLFYYQQIVGLDPGLCGLALFIALLIDAVTDPAVGVWSDGLRSRFGRRHPFMYASSVPLAVCFVGVFMPPTGLSQTLLFLWLLGFAAGTRFAMTLFAIPHQALVPELTKDYDERTSLQTLRLVFAWLFGLMYALLAYAVFLRATEQYPQGLLNPDGYTGFAIWGAIIMVVTTVFSSLGTQRAALQTQVDESRIQQARLRDLPQDIKTALQSPSYRSAVLGGLCLWVSFGVNQNLNNYVNTFLWGFTSEQLTIFIFVLMACAVLALVITRPLAQWLGKKQLIIVTAIVAPLILSGQIFLRLAGLLPGNGEPILMWIVGGSVFVSYSAMILSMIMVGSMIADITDEHELRTGVRQEGLLFSANAFIVKASSGLGVLVSGFVIKLAAFPANATPGSIDPQVVHNLGLFTALITLLFGVGMVLGFRPYQLTRERHEAIMEELQQVRASA
jgi:GPH family glycoside/pentoside/hexuronide:cation symporter